MRNIRILFLSVLFLSIFLRQAAAEETLGWGDCVREAAKNHPDLIAAEEEVKQSEAEKKITASPLFPQVDSNLSASTAKTETETSKKTADSYSYGLTGSQLIFDGVKTINEVRAASEDIKAAKENFRFTSATVRFRLRSAFVNLLTAQEMLRITQEIYEIRRENLQLITLRYASGLEHRGALLTAKADITDAEYGVFQAKRDLEVARRDLIKEMGRSAFSLIAVRGDFAVRDTARDKPDFPLLAQDNPSLKQLMAQKNSAEFNLKSTYGNFFPTLSGQAGANKNGIHWSPQGNQWNLGLTVSLPIFEGGLRFAQVSQARALLGQLKANERSTKDGIILTLEEAWAGLQDAMDNTEVQRQMLAANEERSKIGQAQYSLGLLTFDNWIIIEDNLVQSKKDYLDAQSNALLTEAYWIQAKGETLEYE